MKKLTLILFVAIVFSCQTEEIDDPDVNVDSPVLLKSITVKYVEGLETIIGLERNIEFSYLGSKIISIKSPRFRTVNSQLVETERLSSYEYDEDKITKVTIQNGDIIELTIEFQYQDDRLIKYKSTSYRDNGTVGILANYNVQWESDYLSNNVMYEELDNEVFQKNKFDSNSNLIEAEYYGTINGTYRSYQTKNLKFDNNKNPLDNITGVNKLTQIADLFSQFKYNSYGKNNHTENTSDYDIFSQYRETRSFSFEYNSQGYPSSSVYEYKRDGEMREKNIYTYNY